MIWLFDLMNVQIGWFKDQRLIDLFYKEFVNGFVYHNNQKDVVFCLCFCFFFPAPKNHGDDANKCKKQKKPPVVWFKSILFPSICFSLSLFFSPRVLGWKLLRCCLWSAVDIVLLHGSSRCYSVVDLQSDQPISEVIRYTGIPTFQKDWGF